MLAGGEHPGPGPMPHAVLDGAGQRLVQLLHGDQGHRPPVSGHNTVGQRRVALGQGLARPPPRRRVREVVGPAIAVLLAAPGPDHHREPAEVHQRQPDR